jgi:hypothetical protein
VLQDRTAGTAAHAVACRENVSGEGEHGDGFWRQRSRFGVGPGLIVAAELADGFLGPAQLLDSFGMLAFGSRAAVCGAVLLGRTAPGRSGDRTGARGTLANEIDRAGLPSAFVDYPE